MASNKQVFVSPGVYTSELDLTFVSRQVGVTTAGIVGETVKGPAFQPIFVSNYDEFKAFFGGQNPEKFAGNGMPKYETPYIAKSYLSETNQLFVTRVLGFTGYEAGQSWAITLDAALDDSTVGTTGGGTTDASLISFTADTNGIITSLTSTDPLVQALYDDGSLVTDLAFLGSASTGDTATIGNTFLKTSETGTNFSGTSLDIVVTSEVPTTGGTGTASGVTVHYSGTSYSDVEDKVVAVLRSRGQYDGDEQVIFEFSGSNQVNISTSNDAAQTDPLAAFTLSGTSNVQGLVSYDVSLDKTKKNYITRVLGISEKDGKSALFVEELYQAMFDKFNGEGKVRGINLELIEYDLSFDDYTSEYTNAITPYIVSELRGSEVLKLFRFHTISDGNYANREFKISIANIQPDDKEFDVIVRAFSDTDANPVILERFSRCTMDPTSNKYIGRRIGTVDGDYPAISNYILVELSDDADTSDAFPAGFTGYPVRDYDANGNTGVQAPSIMYKTSYASTEKKRKFYLGLSNTEGIDQDLFDYKGVDASGDTFTGLTKGFHMDSGATSVNIGSETFDFEVGNAEFRTDIGVQGTDYDKVNSRKFTFAPYGGFDGWDIYRDQRTNEDTYAISGTKGALSYGKFNARALTNGEEGNNSDYYAYLEAIRTFSNPESVNINVLTTPGIDTLNNSNLVEETIDMVETERADALYIVTTPDFDAAGDVLDIDDVVEQLDGQYDSNYTATYFPWVQYNDTENNQYIWLPPTKDVLRNIALTDNIAFPWYAIAGVNRGQVDAVKPRINLTLPQREALYAGRINPIANFSTEGTVIWGNKTLQEKESALDRINVRRLLLRTRKLISAVSIRLLFEQNDDIVRNEFLSLVNPILESIRQERGITEFKVRLNENADRNTLSGTIFLVPTDALERIEIEFTVTNAGASFDNI